MKSFSELTRIFFFLIIKPLVQKRTQLVFFFPTSECNTLLYRARRQFVSLMDRCCFSTPVFCCLLVLTLEEKKKKAVCTVLLTLFSSTKWVSPKKWCHSGTAFPGWWPVLCPSKTGETGCRRGTGELSVPFLLLTWQKGWSPQVSVSAGAFWKVRRAKEAKDGFSSCFGEFADGQGRQIIVCVTSGFRWWFASLLIGRNRRLEMDVSSAALFN